MITPSKVESSQRFQHRVYYHREIISIVPVEMDVIWRDREAGGYWVQQISLVAAVRVWERDRPGGSNGERCQDEVIPFLGSSFDWIDATDQCGYLGMIPRNADAEIAFEPEYGDIGSCLGVTA